MCNNNPIINLSTGETSKFSHIGSVKLKHKIKRKNVLCIPSFKHNLLSVNKLCHDKQCKVVFYGNYCFILDEKSGKVVGVRKGGHGLYYMMNENIDNIFV